MDTSASHYLWGGIRNLKLVGPGGSDSYGLWLGGDTTNAFAPAGYNDFGSSYYNINIRGFTVRSTTTEMQMLSMFVRGARGLENNLRAERERSGNVNAVVLRLAEDRKKVCHLQHIAELFPEMKQFEVAPRLLGS